MHNTYIRTGYRHCIINIPEDFDDLDPNNMVQLLPLVEDSGDDFLLVWR